MSDESNAVREAWEKNARWWSDRFGEGNDFHLNLIAPPVEKLLDIQAGESILDIACGNGAFSRRMADLGAHVVAFDFSAPFIECARERSRAYTGRIEYHVIDATQSEQMLDLGKGRFSSAVANMALMDMSDIEPLAEWLPRLLMPGGRFVFSIMHPCFNNNAVRLSIEHEQQGAEFTAIRSVRVTKYLTPFESEGIGIVGQPVPQTYYHRPLNDLLRPFLRNRHGAHRIGGNSVHERISRAWTLVVGSLPRDSTGVDGAIRGLEILGCLLSCDPMCLIRKSVLFGLSGKNLT